MIFHFTKFRTYSHFLCSYNDLRLRIFSKYPHLFPEEVFISYFLNCYTLCRIGWCISVTWVITLYVGKLIPLFTFSCLGVLTTLMVP